MHDITNVKQGLRQRSRDVLRAQIAAAAIVIFDERGFDETTVDELVVQVGISPRSFFRYFPSKEDVVVGDPMPFGAQVRDRLIEEVQKATVWRALRAAFQPIVELIETDPELHFRGTRVMIRTPALRARSAQKHVVWAELLTPIVRGSIASDRKAADFLARVVTTSALACLDAAFEEWVARDGRHGYAVVLDETFALMKPAAAE